MKKKETRLLYSDNTRIIFVQNRWSELSWFYTENFHASRVYNNLHVLNLIYIIRYNEQIYEFLLAQILSFLSLINVTTNYEYIIKYTFVICTSLYVGRIYFNRVKCIIHDHHWTFLFLFQVIIIGLQLYQSHLSSCIYHRFLQDEPKLLWCFIPYRYHILYVPIEVHAQCNMYVYYYTNAKVRRRLSE